MIIPDAPKRRPGTHSTYVSRFARARILAGLKGAYKSRQAQKQKAATLARYGIALPEMLHAADRNLIGLPGGQTALRPRIA